MNNYYINLKKRKNKTYYKLRNEEITFSICRECHSSNQNNDIFNDYWHKQGKLISALGKSLLRYSEGII